MHRFTFVCCGLCCAKHFDCPKKIKAAAETQNENTRCVLCLLCEFVAAAFYCPKQILIASAVRPVLYIQHFYCPSSCAFCQLCINVAVPISHTHTHTHSRKLGKANHTVANNPRGHSSAICGEPRPKPSGYA